MIDFRGKGINLFWCSKIKRTLVCTLSINWFSSVFIYLFIYLQSVSGCLSEVNRTRQRCSGSCIMLQSRRRVWYMMCLCNCLQWRLWTKRSQVYYVSERYKLERDSSTILCKRYVHTDLCNVKFILIYQGYYRVVTFDLKFWKVFIVGLIPYHNPFEA